MRGGYRTGLAGSIATMSNEPAPSTWRGMRDIMGAAALLLGIMVAVTVAITLVVFLILVLLHVLSG
jgi:hypothetical protein